MKISIRIKLLVLTVLLSAGLIVAAVLVSTDLYGKRLAEAEEKRCVDSSKEMALMLSRDYYDLLSDMRVAVQKIYQENYEDIMYYSTNVFSYDERKTYFYGITDPLYQDKTPRYDGMTFWENAQRALQFLEIVARADGMYGGFVCFYDTEHGNLVYLLDTTADRSLLFNFTASAETIEDPTVRAGFAQAKEAFAFRDEEHSSHCNGVCPIMSKTDPDQVIAFVGFYRDSESIGSYAQTYRTSVFFLLLAATAALAVAFLFFADFLIIRNINKLNRAVEQFTGSMDTESRPAPVSANVRTRDEIGSLSARFDRMQARMLGYVDSIAEQTAREEKLKAELDIAGGIQQAAMPSKELNVNNAHISSFLHSAKEVGGDFFDYFRIGKNRLFFYIADVSGKSVPAALFMMRCKERIKAGIGTGSHLDRFAQTLNEDLCRDNKEGFFVSAFFCVYEIDTGRLHCLRAGHEQPFLVRNGHAIRIAEESNFVLGAFANMSYTAEVITLESGDRLLLYTDGLNEGINAKVEEFGYDRIRSVLESAQYDVLDTMYRSHLAFVGEAEQFDDLTMVLLELDVRTEVTVERPTFDDIPPVIDRVSDLLSLCDPVRTAEVGVILDEVLNNVISYAFAEQPAPILHVLAALHDGMLRLEVTDNGCAFDPTVAKQPDLDAEADGRLFGGYGIHLVRSLSQSVGYDRIDGRNILSIEKDMREKADPV